MDGGAVFRVTNRVLSTINRSGLEYVVTGALAAGHYARPRTTLNINVVEIEKDHFSKLAIALSKAHLNVQEKRLCASVATLANKVS